MKMLKILGLILITGVFCMPVFAQNGPAKTVTNADLAKYTQARVKADEDYRQNYEKLGMPSPEELDRREEARQKRLSEFNQKVREQRLQEAYYQSLAASAAARERDPQVVYVDRGREYSSGFYSFGYGGVRRATFFSPGIVTFGSGLNLGPNFRHRTLGVGVRASSPWLVSGHR